MSAYNRNLLLCIALWALAGTAWIGFNLTIPAIILGAAGFYFWLVVFRMYNKANRQVSEQTTTTDTQLRAEVIAVQKLAMTKLATADDEFQTQAAALIADAAMHLGFPYMNGRLVYSSDYTLDWNKQGLAKIAEARALIEGYQPKVG